MTVQNLTQIPAPRVPLIDERSGLMSREWYRFFINLFNLTGNGSNVTSLTDLQIGPPTQEIVPNFEAAVQPSVSQISELQNELQAMQIYDQISSLSSELAEVQNQLQAMNLQPADTPQISRLRYGAFYDTTTQTAAAINTAYPITFNTSSISNGVTIGTPTSRIYVDTHNVYNIQFSAQLDNTSGGNHLAFIWLRINGVDVTDSAGQTRVKGNDGELVAAWNYVVQLNAGDYFEIIWSVSDTAVQMLAQTASAPVPGIPSIILTVTDNISA
jgi:hypothetical protein